MPFLGNESEEDIGYLLSLIKESIKINSHFEFFLWLQGSIQKYLPHQIMIAAWGDFSLGIVYYDIVSAIPGVRTSSLDENEIVQFLKRIHNHWINHGNTPSLLISETSVFRCRDITDLRLKKELQEMKSALIHAINDVRGGSDCLYVLISSKTDFHPSTRNAFQFLLPYIDASLRRIEHLPTQLPKTPADLEPLVATDYEADEFSLSSREAEIMEWVCMGKTNVEIGIILNISSFTVKNHLQRIFKKLNVYKRSQAVSVFQSMPSHTQSI